MSWGALYYTVPVLYDPISRETGWSQLTLTAMFSGALVIAAGLGPAVGAVVDRQGPRYLVTAGTVIGAVGLTTMAGSTHPATFALGLAAVGVAQAATLYPPVFAALAIWLGPRRTTALTVVSLFGGASSAIFAPVLATCSDAVGWRRTVFLLAIVFVAVTAASAWSGLRFAWPMDDPEQRKATASHVEGTTRSARFRLLQLSMMLCGLGLYGVTLNLIALVTESGHPYSFAAMAFALVGVGQVAGRIAYLPLADIGSPRTQTFIQVAASVAVIAMLGLAEDRATLAAAAVLAGMVRGAHTLVMATGVVDRWGTDGFGVVSGRFNRPVALSIAAAPFAGAGLAAVTGSYSAATLTLAALTAGAAILAPRT